LWRASTGTIAGTGSPRAREIQLRRVAGQLFGFIKPDILKGVTG
jgi:hypothetical protein